MAICSATASATASATSPGSLALKQLRSDSEQREIDDFEEEERRIMSQDSGPQDSQVCFFVWPIWQYGLWSFLAEGTKLERFLPKNQNTSRKLLNFENWVSGEVSKSGHHFIR